MFIKRSELFLMKKSKRQEARMIHREWTEEQKFKIVLEGLRGETPVTKLCEKYEISQTQYYKWRDMFMEHGKEMFTRAKRQSKEERMEREIVKLKKIIGDLTVELKKNEYE